ncbi:MAG: alpha-galactosidase [Promicromonosporaceae bacterium]|nr:alpha-galactosidase [Promicromonosporaceae bacterium]
MIESTGKQFYLQTADSSYWFRVTKFGHLEHVYYGPALPVQDMEPLALKRTAQWGSTVAYDQDDLNYSLDIVPLEWSGTGYGDYRFAPAELVMPDGSYSQDFTYVRHVVTPGYHPMKTLPSAYGTNGECDTLTITLRDNATRVELDLIYTVFEQVNVIARRVVLRNASSGEVVINRLLSGMVDLPGRGLNLITFDGGWIKETHKHVRPLEYGFNVNSSTTGASSNRHNPGFLLAEQTATESCGLVYGFNLVYSGNHLGIAELHNNDLARVAVGINDHCFNWRLDPGESFETPQMVMTVSDQGFNGASHNFHDFINQNIVRGGWKNKERPVLFNNWEAHFFDFDQSKLEELASSAKKLGAELFVLDDGWFGKRDADNAGLGDYSVNLKKLPKGLAGFGKYLNKIGLDFGLWFEPEMVNEDSDLFRKHPEWASLVPGRRHAQGRNQYVLDLTNPAVQDYLIKSVSQIIDENHIQYVKWDMNRHISDAFSPLLENQGEFFHRYMIGLYRVLKQIFITRPHVLLESCSSGGNRFDLGMLCFSPQVWSSDDTDPVERLAIQGGLSYLYPPSTMGAHVSAAPHQQTLRLTPMSTRFNVAAFGVLGYELDLKYVGRLEQKEIKDQIEFYKRHRRTLQFGRFSRIDNPKPNKVCWQTAARDGHEVISGFFQTQATAAEGYDTLKVLDLNPKARYELSTRPQPLYLARFGGLIKHVLPVELAPDGVIMRTAGKLYKMDDAVEHYQGTGALFAQGVMLANQFIGSHYNAETRLLGDFGSSLYVTELKK